MRFTDVQEDAETALAARAGPNVRERWFARAAVASSSAGRCRRSGALATGMDQFTLYVSPRSSKTFRRSS